MLPFCTDLAEDEYHFLLECQTYSDLRERYIHRYIPYLANRSFTFLFNGKGYIKTKHVAMFIHYALKRRRELLANDANDEQP